MICATIFVVPLHDGVLMPQFPVTDDSDDQSHREAKPKKLSNRQIEQLVSTSDRAFHEKPIQPDGDDETTTDSSKEPDLRGHIKEKRIERNGLLWFMNCALFLMLFAPFGVLFAPQKYYDRFTTPELISVYEGNRNLLVAVYTAILLYYFPNAGSSWIKSIVEKLLSGKS